MTETVDVVGMASDVKNGKPLYCEYHYSQGEGGESVLVEYRNPDQELIAHKQLDFSDSLLAPNVIQNDFRHEELRVVSLLFDNDSGSPRYHVQYRRANETVIAEAKVRSSGQNVIDAGFDQAVRQHWQYLLDGNKVVVDYISPVHLRAIKLKIKRSQGERCRPYISSADDVCFLIRPNSRLLSLLVKPLALIYDVSHQRLLTFVGNVNITDLNGSAFKAIIRYQYPR